VSFFALCKISICVCFLLRAYVILFIFAYGTAIDSYAIEQLGLLLHLLTTNPTNSAERGKQHAVPIAIHIYDVVQMVALSTNVMNV
jgi:hypothetical protein